MQTNERLTIPESESPLIFLTAGDNRSSVLVHELSYT